MLTRPYRNLCVVAAGAALAVAAAGNASVAQAQGVMAQAVVAPPVVPPTHTSYALTYGEWSARWWQYIYGIPLDQNPLSSSNTPCSLGQWGPVWFLAGTGVATTGPVTRSCNVPANTALFFPLINVSCAIPDDGTTRDQLVQVCKPSIDSVNKKSLFVTVDSVGVNNLDKYRVSEFFSLTGAIPSWGYYKVPPNPQPCTGTPSLTKTCYEGFRDAAFTDGYWIMLSPLKTGWHTLHFGGKIPGVLTVDVTYHLHVLPPPPK